MTDSKEFEKRVGTTLRGKWTLEKLLGVGGMAAVYVAAHKIGRRDAIKILHPEVARSKDLRQRFEQEAHAVNRFKHPGAVEIRDIDTTEEGAPFLVMELLDGESLSDLARRQGGVETAELLGYVDELLDVLAAAHEQGIVHRDIKLDNLFVLKTGRLKVLDFGIARMREGAPKSMNTRTGATLGTVPYMPPEQVKGLEIDGRADIFAVGATMFRLIAKRRIHDASSESDMLVKMATQPAPPLASVATDVSPELAMVVDRALAFQRDRRYPNAQTMQEDVRALRRGEPPAYASARLEEGDLPGSMALSPGAAKTAASSFADGPTVTPPLRAVVPAALGGAFPGSDDPTRAPTGGVGSEATVSGGTGAQANGAAAKEAPTMAAPASTAAPAAAAASAVAAPTIPGGPASFRDAATMTTAPAAVAVPPMEAGPPPSIGAAVEARTASGGAFDAPPPSLGSAGVASQRSGAADGTMLSARTPGMTGSKPNNLVVGLAAAGLLFFLGIGVTVWLLSRSGAETVAEEGATSASAEPSVEPAAPDATGTPAGTGKSASRPTLQPVTPGTGTSTGTGAGTGTSAKTPTGPTAPATTRPPTSPTSPFFPPTTTKPSGNGKGKGKEKKDH